MGTGTHEPAPPRADSLEERLAKALAPVLGATVRVEGLQRLAGGASRETWQFTAAGATGHRRELILRRDPPRRPGPPGGMSLEARALRAAHAAGLPVPLVLVDDAGPESFGAAGMVMERVEGEAIARRILRDPAYARAREVLAVQCGECLARLHAVPPSEVPGLPDEDALIAVRLWYDQVGQPSATFEWAFRWLDTNRPAETRRAVVHGDFRLGNLMVGPEGLRAVLDWELVHAGDPLEDLGWLCTKAWRFGHQLPVGGFGRLDELIGAYEAAGGAPVDRDALRWWQVFGTLRWGVICMGQAAVHLHGALRSVELATIGRRVCEQEWDLLELLGALSVTESASDAGGTGTRGERAAPPTSEPGSDAGGTGTRGERAASPTAESEPPAAEPEVGLHGRPTAEELLTAVREFLEGDVAEATEGRVRFHARVAANAVTMVARELSLGPAAGERYHAGLARFGVATEADLATAVRLGQLDDRTDELIGFLRSSVRDKLAVANPAHVEIRSS